MASLNKVVLIGNMTADAELKQTQSGIFTTSFSIGVSRPKRKGDEAAKSDFINIVAWRNTAEFVSKYFKKGSPICICGSIQTRSYDAKDGTKRYVTEVVADEVTFVGNNNGNKSENAPAVAETPQVNFEEIGEDDDMPF